MPAGEGEIAEDAVPREVRVNTPLFPKHTVQWHIHEPTAMRKLTLSMWEMAFMTGVVIRLYRAVVLNYNATTWIWVGAIFIGVLLFCAMATMHLANYPLKRWLWRAPLFALLEVTAESVTSLGLIALGREPLATARAEWHDWPQLAFDTLLTREGVVLLWAGVLALIVTIVRRVVLRERVEEEPVVE